MQTSKIRVIKCNKFFGTRIKIFQVINTYRKRMFFIIGARTFYYETELNLLNVVHLICNALQIRQAGSIILEQRKLSLII